MPGLPGLPELIRRARLRHARLMSDSITHAAFAGSTAPPAQSPAYTVDVPFYGFLDGEEIRAPGVASAAGDNIILPKSNNFDIEILEVALQCSSIGSVIATLKESQVAIDGAWNLSVNQFVSLPGKIIDRSADLILNLSAAVPVTFNVRWRPSYLRPIGGEGEGPAE